MPERIELVCTYCGDDYTRHPSNAIQSRFCSASCQHKHRHEHPEEHFSEKKTKYQEWRERVFDRDGESCHHCGKDRAEGVLDLQLHHVIPSKYFLEPVQSYFSENLVTLCSVCHTAWDGETRRIAEGGDSQRREIECAIKCWITENRPFANAPDGSIETSEAVDLLRDEFYQEFSRVGQLEKEVQELRDRVDD